MKKVIFFISLFFIFTISSCDKNDNHVSETNSEVVNSYSEKRTVSNEFILVGSENNPYNINGYNYILQINNMVEEIVAGNLDSDSLIGQYISNSFENDYSLSASDISKYVVFLSSNEYTLDNILLFESLIISEGNASIDMLKSLSYIKYSIYYASVAQTGGGLAAFDACVDNCIRRKLSEIFNDGNNVDRAQFIVGCPISFAWIVASCTYECS